MLKKKRKEKKKRGVVLFYHRIKKTDSLVLALNCSRFQQKISGDK